MKHITNKSLKSIKTRTIKLTKQTKNLLRAGKSLLDKKFKNRKFYSGESKVGRAQKIVALGVGVVIVLVLTFILKDEIFPKQRPVNKNIRSRTNLIHAKKFDTLGDNISKDEVWRYRMSEKGKKTSKQIEEVKSVLSKLITESQNRKTSDMDLVQRRIAYLEKQLRETQAASRDATSQNKGIERIDINLRNKEAKKIDTVDNVIPAGAFAKAVLLSGVDAPTSLSASNDPLPVLVRVTDPGTLPRKFKSDLKDCHVIAGGYGDLSSERVYLRLERLTCTERATGEIIETEIAGFVTGEDGKSGMRGRVVEKASKYLSNSVIGGLIGGLSSTLAPQDGAVPYISLTSPKAPSATDRFQRGFAGGMSSSMDRLSQYYIDRAESLQPVIEVSPGRIIDIIFTAKSEIGSTRVKQEIARRRDSKRQEIARDLAAKDRFKL